MKQLLLFLLFSSVIEFAHAQSVTHYVKLGATGDGSGLSWANASTDLQWTISNANSGDSVFVAGGPYLAPLNESFSMKNGVKIYGSFKGTEASLAERTMAAGDTSILRGNGSSVIRNNGNGLDTSAVLDGFKITGGGGVNFNGGGIYNHQSSPTFANVIIIGNTANGGSGGGMYNDWAYPILTNVIICGNNATFGGGMYNYLGTPILKNVLICGNTATKGGGGMVLYDSPLTLTNLTICGNSAGYGGGIYIMGASLILTNSILWGNNGNNDGNEIVFGSSLHPTTITLNYSLFRNRSGQNDLESESGNAIVPDAFSLSVSPEFVDSAGGNYRLSAGSPAIDAGTPSTDTAGLDLPIMDLAGNGRILGHAIDIGAYEFRSIHPDVAGILYVDSAVASSGDGSSWEQALASFGDALTAAGKINTAATGSVEQIWVAKGTYQPASGGYFSMLPKVKIYGSFGGTEASLEERTMSAGDTSILKGNGSSVIRNDQNGLDASAVLDGFKITGGGGSYIAGGGIYNNQSSPIFANLIICGNTSVDIAGGGMFNSSASPILKNVIISGNSAFDGGGMFNTSSSPIFKDVLICGNTATQSGGGMAHYDSQLTLTNVTICGNSSAYGGGIFNSNSSIIINNSILWGNNSGNLGNEIYFGLTPSPSIITLNYSLFRNRGDGSDIYGLSGNTLAPDAFSLSVSPQFVDSADGDYRLSASSPAIDAGTPSTDTAGLNLPITDLAGNIRILGSGIDIGAYEFRNIHPDATGILYVDSAVTVPGDGSSWELALASFGDAVTAANTLNSAVTGSVEQVWVANGTYQPASGGFFAMVPKVKIYGSFVGNEASLTDRRMAAGDTSILKGNGNSVIRNNDNGLDASAVLDGFKITGDGGVYVDGGGIYNGRVSPTFSHLMISGNASNRGGGMFNGQSSPILTNVIIKGNTADDNYGGGMYNFSSSPILTNVIISGNSAYGGGGMEYRQSHIILTNVIISDNTAASQGGGMDNILTSGTLTNVTISGNSAAGQGGGINNLGSSLILNNSIIWGNNGNNNGNELYSMSLGPESFTTTLNYSLFRNRDGNDNYNDAGSTIVPDAFSLSVSPQFVDAAGGDYRLSAGSPAIDAGNTTLLAGDDIFDLSGNPRVVNSMVDMGAYEYQGTAVPVSIQSFTGTIKNSTATLNWQSGVESNFKGYQLEKSTDGNHFTKLASVAAKGSNSDYHFSTPQTATKAWYRLQLIDQTGASTYYDQIVALQLGAVPTTVLVYPNPATDYIHIRIAAEASISLYDAAGRLVKQQDLSAGINQIDIRSLNAGIYYGVVNGQKVKFVKK